MLDRRQGEFSGPGEESHAEARAVERARIILVCLEGKEIQQVARELSLAFEQLFSS